MNAHDIKIALLKSERRWDENLCHDLGRLEMPFGRYKGKELSQISLRYLDQTVSVMPQTYFVRRVIEFVDNVMHGCGFLLESDTRPPDRSFDEVYHNDFLPFAKEAGAALEKENPSHPDHSHG